MNVQDDKPVQFIVDFVVKKFGRIYYAVNAAGISHMPSSSKWELAELVALNIAVYGMCLRCLIAA
ncbi:putative Oxidoreductase [Seiridium unicorne]|uniref:Oxidoreductase n=1 Tax=Seiridium unicorne TaxID=138068 RepID=A0ABR2ULF3_9PEZI